jgi:4'-phosphopantetheinyl transferase
MELYWLEQSAADLPASVAWLSAVERLRLAEMKIPKRRDDWRLGRWTAKLALAGYLGLPSDLFALSEIEIRPHATGAPEAFVQDAPAKTSLSLSHRDGLAICAAASEGVALGCDLELVEPRSDAFVADYFTAEEQEMMSGSPTAVRDLLVTLLWSAKESALKALRTGLRLDTRAVSPTLHGGIPAAVYQAPLTTWFPLSVRHGDQLFAGWWSCIDGFVRTTVSAPAADAPMSARFAAASSRR